MRYKLFTILLFFAIFIFSQNLYSQDTIIELDNTIFSMSDGNYTFFANKETNNEINENFFREIISGNIFVLLNWLNFFTIEKKNETIKIKTSQTHHKTEISRNFISLFISYFNRLVDNRIAILYQEFITVDYKTETNNTIYIYEIAGITINNNMNFSEKLFNLLDISRYKLIYQNKYIFLGITNPEKEQFFDYYIYTSIDDINNRGFSEVFEQSNNEIRNKLKPFVKNLFK